MLIVAEKAGKEKQNNKQKKMADLNPTISIITLKENSLSTIIRQTVKIDI